MVLDFDGNLTLSIKYGIHTLAYSTLLKLYTSLKQALVNDKIDDELSVDDLCREIEYCVFEIAQSKIPENLPEACELLAACIAAKEKKIRYRSISVADLLIEFNNQIMSLAPTWSYRRDVQKWHDIGENLAKAFFDDCQHELIEQNLKKKAFWKVEYDFNADKAPFSQIKDSQVQAITGLTNTITIRYSFTHDFQHYIKYPFYFMHEYVSHIYSVDSKSELFEDGWLLYAAAESMINHESKGSSNLHGEQRSSYHIGFIKSSVAKSGFKQGLLLDHFLFRANGEEGKKCFLKLMHSLCATPRNGVRHSLLLHYLDMLREENKSKLLDIIDETSCCAETIWNNHFTKDVSKFSRPNTPNKLAVTLDHLL